MSEQVPDLRPNEIPITEMYDAHEAAQARDHHETNAALALAAMKLVEQVAHDNGNVGTGLDQEYVAAQQNLAANRTSRTKRDMAVARTAAYVYGGKSNFYEQRHLAQLGDGRRDLPTKEERTGRAVADTKRELSLSAQHSLSEADAAEERAKRKR